MSIRSCFSCNCWSLKYGNDKKRKRKIKVDGNFFTLFIFLWQFFLGVFCCRWMRKIIVKGDLKTKRIIHDFKFVCFHLKLTQKQIFFGCVILILIKHPVKVFHDNKCQYTLHCSVWFFSTIFIVHVLNIFVIKRDKEVGENLCKAMEAKGKLWFINFDQLNRVRIWRCIKGARFLGST